MPIAPQIKILTTADPSGSSKFVADITQEAIGWRRSIRAQGGYWQGSFSMRGSLDDLQQVFYYWLGLRVKEISGGQTTWDGMIYEMDLTYHGVTRRRSLDLMCNYVTVFYEDDEGETQNTTAVTNTDSIQHYGRYEGMWTLDTISQTAAEAFGNTRLKELGWPLQRVVGVRPGEIESNEAILDVVCCGYIFTANWRFEQVGDGSQDNLSDWISEILTTDCEFLEPGIVNENTLQVYKANSQPRRCWDVMLELAAIGDSSSNPWRIYCGNDRLVHYEQISATKKYYLRDGKLRGPFSSEVLANPWTVTPAVVRDADYPIAGSQNGGWLIDNRDFYVEEVECGVDTGLVLKSSEFDEGEILIAQLEYLASMFNPEDED